jgi:hypothetical protein
MKPPGAEAICDAVTRPNMRFVPTKTVEQLSCLILYRARQSFEEPTPLNAFCSHAFLLQ